MSEQKLVVNRWRRFGKDRLYVEMADGSKVGFWDLVEDAGHPETPEHTAQLTAAIGVWKAESATTVIGAAPTGFVPTATAGKDGEHLTTALAGKSVDSAHVPDPPVRTIEPAVGDLAASPTPVDEPAPAPARPWVDLADNQPGAEAREQAQAAREAAPVRTVLARVLGVHTDERAWRIGAEGEERVAAQLAKVAKKDPRWRFLHAIPVGDRGSDIDHLIVGPGGVFTVNAKNHPKAKIWVGGNTFMVNGHRQPYIRNSRHEAERAARLLTAACGLPVVVEGLIVTVNAADVTIKSQPDGVSVTWRNNLATWLLRHGDIHTTETVDSIYEAARRSTTWRT